MDKREMYCTNNRYKICKDTFKYNGEIFMTKVKKTLDEHQRDIEDIVEEKGGEIIGKYWKVDKTRTNRPYFRIKCDKGHTWDVIKYSLMPSKNNPKGSWCPHRDCQGKKSLLDHQRDIEGIVEAKGGEIIGKYWKKIKSKGYQYNAPFFRIKCDRGHIFEIRKSNLMPTKSNPKGSWCAHPDCMGKSLLGHQRDIEDIVKAKGGRIIGKYWKNIKSKGYQYNAPFFRIKCDKGHTWDVIKYNLIPNKHKPLGTWCPKCDTHYCERIMCKIVEQLFNVKCKQTSLNTAYGIPREQGGNLRFDGFIKITINKVDIFIAFEYDGIQHDYYPNYLHKTQKEFDDLQRRDALKEKLARQHNTILIRIKAKEGFHLATIEKFPSEIIRQFNIAMKGKRINFRLDSKNFDFDINLKKVKETLDKFL